LTAGCIALTDARRQTIFMPMLNLFAKKSTKAKGNRASGLWWILCVE
jgi:hypothetical protein